MQEVNALIFDLDNTLALTQDFHFLAFREVFAKHGVLGLARVIAKEGAPYKIHSYVVCPGFVLTPLVQKQIPEQAAALNLTEEQVVKNIMLKDTVDGEFTTTDDVANLVSYLAQDVTGALTGQSINVSHGWSMK